MHKVGKNVMFVGLGEKITQVKWMVNSMVKNTPLMLAFLSNFKNGASYWRHENNLLPDHTKYNTQFCNDPSIQHFMWGD